jgi:DNA topoisomerase-1
VGKSLVIVESPAKAKTINKFLGKNFTVLASMGHVRDLPKRELGVDEESFEPVYTVLVDKKKVITDLKKAAKTADAIYLASDPDREGEAICWHLYELLKKSTKATFHRVLFNEITKRAILQAFEQPIEIDTNKVEAQQARRILDRLVGYKISPLLWEKVRRGLSAGRVQSVALRMICEREQSIRAFISNEYWLLGADLESDQPPPFNAKFVLEQGKKIEIGSQDSMQTVLNNLGWEIEASNPVEDGPEGAVTLTLKQSPAGLVPFKVTEVHARESQKKPLPPFITSKLQQDAARQFGFPVAKTMRLAQGLYEGKEIGDAGTVGLITYMRTDSTRVATEAVDAVRTFISTSYGEKFLPEKPRSHKIGKSAQEGHEAIRPTTTEYDPETVKSYLGRDEFRLYQLIWNRFVASQMASAVFDKTRADIEAGPYTFRAHGSVLRFAGWLTVYNEGKDEDATKEKDDDNNTRDEDRRLPELVEGQELNLKELLPRQKFTQPPPRFSEAALVKALEENGIGRPSTYAQILYTILDRDYVEKENRHFKPTELGLLVNELMVASFGDLIDIGYTARMEEALDKIEEGQLGWVDALRDFHIKFTQDLEKAKIEMRDVKREAIPTDQICDKCEKPMVLKWGRFGQFLACSGYPECRNTRELEVDPNGSSTGSGNANGEVVPISAAKNPIEVDADPCEKCGEPMVLKRGRYGQFLACSAYPDCKTTRKVMIGKDGKAEAKADVLLDETCPLCEARLSVKQGRYGEFTACSNYPKCRHVKMKETGVHCPECSKGTVVERRSKRGKLFFGCSNYPDCTFVLWKKPVNKPCPDCGQSYLVERNTKRDGHQYICDSENCEYTVVAED